MRSRRPEAPPGGASRRALPPTARAAPAPADASRAGDASAERTVTLAAIIGAHGIAGEVRLKLFTDDLERYGGFAVGARTLTLTSLRPGANGAVARFAEIGDRNAAEALRGATLTVPRSGLPPLEAGEYYHADLIGLPCVSPDGEEIGRAVALENFGAGDIVEIEKPDGRRFMVPVALAVTMEPDRLLIDPDFME